MIKIPHMQNNEMQRFATFICLCLWNSTPGMLIFLKQLDTSWGQQSYSSPEKKKKFQDGIREATEHGEC